MRAETRAMAFSGAFSDNIVQRTKNSIDFRWARV